jgi:hypothetical protein
MFVYLYNLLGNIPFTRDVGVVRSSDVIPSYDLLKTEAAMKWNASPSPRTENRTLLWTYWIQLLQ